MASRTKQKEQARARRLAEEQAQAEKARRDRRLRMLGGVVLIAAAIVAVAIAVSSSGGGSKTAKPNSSQAKSSQTTVDTLLAGIPQSGMTLGSPSAKVTVTEFGDLECPICQEFALSAENQIIQSDVRSGKVKLVYRSLQTASSESPIPNVFSTQQKAAYSAGLQHRGWYYVELFYHEQGQEGTGYVTESYLSGLAQQIPGLNYQEWQLDRNSPTVTAQLTADTQAAQAKNFTGTPSVVVKGPRGEQDFTNLEDFGTYQSAINSVS
ncbi:MAG: thioredoxin domain-containing protein [Solirubrobacterales bacterium]|nr:thioredoxin domain-containing protein [Solirubrobacterales bacterium]